MNDIQPPICPECNERPCERNGRSGDGKPWYRSSCWKCRRPFYHGDPDRRRRAKLRESVKDWTCSRCGFVPEHIGQMDVDHIDGDRFNDEPENLQVLCANCHRLKSILSGDHARRSSRL